jgi:hypothetical protein
MRHNSIVGRRRHVDESIKLILEFQSSSADSKKSWRKSVQIISISCKPPHAEALDTEHQAQLMPCAGQSHKSRCRKSESLNMVTSVPL